MAETPTRNVSFARVIRARDDYREETFDNEDVTCETDLCDSQHGSQQEERVGADTEARAAEGSASVSVGVSVVEDQPPKIDESDKAKNETFHNEVCENLARHFQDLCFVKAYDSAGNSMVVVTQRTLMFHPPMGFTSRIRITIRGFKYEVSVMMKKIESGDLQSIADIQEVCSKFSAESNYKFCPGIDPQYYKSHYLEAIRFNIKSVRQTVEPFARVDSVNCRWWFQLASNATSEEKSAKEVLCSACKRLVTDLNCQRRRTLAESPERKLKRQSASSRAKLSGMSPYSQQKRQSNAQSKRTNMKRKLKKLDETDVTLNDEQHEEMCSIVHGISDEELGKVFLEGSEHGVGELMKEIWYTDSKRQRQQFLQDQSKNGK